MEICQQTPTPNQRCLKKHFKNDFTRRAWLYKCRLVEDPYCTQCKKNNKQEIGNIFHIIWGCPQSQALWSNLNHIIQRFNDWISISNYPCRPIESSIYIDATKAFLGFYDELQPDHIVSILVTYTRWLIVNFASQDLTLTYQMLLPRLMGMLNSIESATISKKI